MIFKKIEFLGDLSQFSQDNYDLNAQENVMSNSEIKKKIS